MLFSSLGFKLFILVKAWFNSADTVDRAIGSEITVSLAINLLMAGVKTEDSITWDSFVGRSK
jgi:hypothetical protein